CLLGLAVRDMRPAEAAVLAQLQSIGRLLLVLLRIVVTTLARGTCHHNHYAILFFCHVTLV
ncbi:MAG: hypothetical protein ACYDHD_07080, partial [Vulcanimicrobiaceae bacterium]